MGIFDEQVGLYEIWRAKLQFRDKLVGGQPKNPKAMREFLVRRTGGEGQEQVRREILRMASEMEVPVEPDMSLDDLEKLADTMAARQGNGFKSDEHGPYIESYQIKAAFKECVSIAFASERWGATRKGVKSYLAERLFINPLRIHVGRKEPDGIQTKCGVVNGPHGKRSILTQSEYVEAARIHFDVKITGDGVDTLMPRMPEIWNRMQDNGLGAMRSSGFGTFDIIEWTKLESAKVKERAKVEDKRSTAMSNANGAAVQAAS